jgi:hypothetical protein
MRRLLFEPIIILPCFLFYFHFILPIVLFSFFFYSNIHVIVIHPSPSHSFSHHLKFIRVHLFYPPPLTLSYCFLGGVWGWRCSGHHHATRRASHKQPPPPTMRIEKIRHAFFLPSLFPFLSNIYYSAQLLKDIINEMSIAKYVLDGSTTGDIDSHPILIHPRYQLDDYLL